MANALNVKIGGDITQLQSALNKASTSIRNAGKRMTDLGKTVSMRVTAPLTALAGVAVKAFGAQEKAELQLRAALRANGREVDSLFGKYNAFAKEMQQTTIVGDETTLAMLAQAEAFGLTGDVAERAVKNSIAMQSAFGVNAQSALRYTAALEEGNATMLTRYLPSLREIDDESERVAEAQRILGNAFTSAEAEAQGSTGQMIQMKNAVGDLMEVVGEVISEAILPFVKRIKEMAEVAQTVDKSVIKMGVAIAGVTAAVGPLLIALGMLAKGLAMVMTPIFAKIAAISAIVLAFEYVRRNLNVFINRIQYGFAKVRNAVVQEVDTILEAIQVWARWLPGNMDLAIVQARASLLTLTDDLPEIEGEFQSAGEFFSSILSDISDGFVRLSDLVFPASTTQKTDQFTASIQRAVIPVKEFGRSLESMRVTTGGVNSHLERLRSEFNRLEQVTNFAQGIADSFTNSFGQGMANVVVQGERLVDVLKNIGKLLASSIIQKALSALLTGGLGGTGFFGSGGGIFGKILGTQNYAGVGGMQPVQVFGKLSGQDIHLSSQRGQSTYGR